VTATIRVPIGKTSLEVFSLNYHDVKRQVALVRLQTASSDVDNDKGRKFAIVEFGAFFVMNPTTEAVFLEDGNGQKRCTISTMDMGESILGKDKPAGILFQSDESDDESNEDCMTNSFALFTDLIDDYYQRETLRTMAKCKPKLACVSSAREQVAKELCPNGFHMLWNEVIQWRTQNLLHTQALRFLDLGSGNSIWHFLLYYVIITGHHRYRAGRPHGKGIA